MTESEDLPVDPVETESYTWGSDEGINAVVNRVRESGEPYTLSLNASDFELVFEALNKYTSQMHASVAEEWFDRAHSLLSGIAESVGVEWV